jgi:four helix bundle protein
MAARDVRDTKVYQKAYSLAMKIFTISKSFPTEEIYSLTGQIRKSSRSVCACLVEAYRKKKYPAHFIAKITDSDMENSETGIWLDFSLSCEYINSETHKKLREENEEIGKMINHILNNPEKY